MIVFAKEGFEMNFSLTPSLEQFVGDSARSGDYHDADEVVREAIRLPSVLKNSAP